MKTTTSTSTKTAIGWVSLSLGAALLSTALLGNPFDSVNRPSADGISTRSSAVEVIQIEVPKMLRVKWDCYDKNGKLIESWAIGRENTGKNDMPSKKDIDKIRRDALNGCKGTLNSSITYTE